MPGKLSNNEYGKKEGCNAIHVAAGEACVRLRSSRET